MITSADTDPWQHVELLHDFVVFLRVLAGEAERMLAVDTDEGETGSWTNRTINDFLWGLAAAVRQRDGGAGLAAEQAEDQVGWRALAFQLYLARTAGPAYNCVLADSRMHRDDVVSAMHLRMFAATLAMDFAREQREIQAKLARGERYWGEGSWAHGQLDAFLGAWSRWLEDAYLKPLPALMVKLGIDRRGVEPVTWNSIAYMLDVGRGYE